MRGRGEARAKELSDKKKREDDALAARIANEANVARIIRESEIARIANEANAARIANEANAVRIANEANAVRIANEANAARIANEANAVRIANEANAARIANEAQAEAVRLANEKKKKDADEKAEFITKQQYEASLLQQTSSQKIIEMKSISPLDKINIPPNDINPYIYYLTSYIYLQRASYKFLLKTDKIDYVYTKTLLNIYDATNKNPLHVSQNNNTTTKWVNINDAQFYKIEIYMAILGESIKNETLSFEILATDKEINADEKENITFASKDFEYVERSMSDTYTDMKSFIYNVDDVNKFKPIYNIIFNGMNYSPTKNVSFLGNLETRYAEIRNYFLGETGTSERQRKHDNDTNKLAIDTENLLKTNADIIAINSLLDEIESLNLESKLSVKSPTINQVSAYSAFNTQDITIINQYITYEQTKETDKARLKGNPNITFNMLSHANRSIYVQEF
jgi:hypothetical protein